MSLSKAQVHPKLLLLLLYNAAQKNVQNTDTQLPSLLPLARQCGLRQLDKRCLGDAILRHARGTCIQVQQ